MSARLRRALKIISLSAIMPFGLTLSGCLEDADGARDAGDGSHKKGSGKEQSAPWQFQKLSEIGKSKGNVNAGEDANLNPEELKAKTLLKMKDAQERAEKLREASDKHLSKTDPARQSKLAKSKNQSKDRTVSVSTPSASGEKSVFIVPPRTDVHAKELKTADLEKSVGIVHTVNNVVPEQKVKQGFFKRWFGENTPPPPPLALAGGGMPRTGTAPNGTAVTIRSPERHTTALALASAEMARERLLEEVKNQEKDNALSPEAQKSETVKLAETPTPSATPASSTPADKPQLLTASQQLNALNTTPTEEESEAMFEQRYRESLASRDMVAREAAFRQAAQDRREDALPFLISEIEHDNALATLAAQCLAAIGINTPEVESALIAALKNHDGIVRQAAGEALGNLHSRRAAAPLLEALKTEKQFPARSAYCGALGQTGDRAAIPVLKKKLEEAGEIEYVKAKAALGLAALGDPSGRSYLQHLLDDPNPALQIIGLNGLAQLNDSDMVGYLSAALESRYTEVWTTATYLFPRVGPTIALPILRMRLGTTNEVVQRRVGLAMGWLGSEDGLPYIEKAIRDGEIQERVMGCELLGHLGRPDYTPMLVAKLGDTSPSVRQASAIALTRLNATDAVPALIEATRGPKLNRDLPPALRGADTGISERLVLLSCIRILRGEKDDLIISTMPNQKNGSWPEVDQVVAKQQLELVKLYHLIDVIAADNVAVGAVLKGPNGKEILLREGEVLTAGFKVRDIGKAQVVSNKEKLPAYVTLMRGDESVRLVEGREPEVETHRRRSK